jgi:phosphoribosyl-ATP pyrophosphohydrolase/phosphoribosyl-AMP cyclohydrolase
VTAATGPVRFDAQGLIPAVVQEATTGEVLMVAWMNAEALERTLATRSTHFWSRSRQALWQKGETSGHRQHVEAVYADCDADTLLVLAHQKGRVPHGSRTCFFTRLDRPAASGAEAAPAPVAGPGILDAVERVIQSRRGRRGRARTCRGSAGGDARLAQKVGEEATEVVVAALAESSERLVAEVADLWFHTLVLMGARGSRRAMSSRSWAVRHRPADDRPARDVAPVDSPED